MDINKAYIVPSIFFGHKRQAKTNIGMEFIYPRTYESSPSPKMKSLSGIPNFLLYLKLKINKIYLKVNLVTSNICESPKVTNIITDTIKTFLNGTFLK